MVRKITVLLISSLLLLAPLSSAHAYACQGKVSRVAVSQNGRISVISTEMFPDGQGRDVCNLYTESKGVQPAVCRGWLAMLMAAQVSNRTVTIQYADNTYSCSSLPTWENALAPWAVYGD